MNENERVKQGLTKLHENWNNRITRGKVETKIYGRHTIPPVAVRVFFTHTAWRNDRQERKNKIEWVLVDQVTWRDVRNHSELKNE